jgi:hypothetical protein
MVIGHGTPTRPWSTDWDDWEILPLDLGGADRRREAQDRQTVYM